jgi:RNA polymerase primary sigma factor
MAKEKAASSKSAKAKAAELLAQISNQPSPTDDETRRTRLKTLIKLGKERGFLTYAEVNDHLPDDVVDAEQIESIISTFNDMGIQVYDEAPDAEDPADVGQRADRRADDADAEERPSRPSRRSTPNSAAPPIRCACTCARWARSNC